jgi:hypothetical protein
MMQTQRDVASFVLRLTQDFWRDTLGEPHVQWRGHIRHVQGDAETAFADFSEAVTFIQQHLAKITANALPGGSPMEQDKLMRESFKLWQQFAATYNDMMFAAMENALKQSDAIKQQMDEAVAKSLKAWNLPEQADQGQLAAALQSLQAQVQALAEKVERLEQSLKAKGA